MKLLLVFVSVLVVVEGSQNGSSPVSDDLPVTYDSPVNYSPPVYHPDAINIPSVYGSSSFSPPSSCRNGQIFHKFKCVFPQNIPHSPLSTSPPEDNTLLPTSPSVYNSPVPTNPVEDNPPVPTNPSGFHTTVLTSPPAHIPTSPPAPIPTSPSATISTSPTAYIPSSSLAYNSYAPFSSPVYLSSVPTSPPEYIPTSPPVYHSSVPTSLFVYDGSPCGNGEVLHEDRCVVPEVSRHTYVYTIPNQVQNSGPRPPVPLPKIERNILFVRLSEQEDNKKPIVVPPPQQKNLIYILKKKTHSETPVIEVPAPPKKNPEVYLVKYDQGQNPILPNGIDLQTALGNNAQHISGEVIGNGSNNRGISVNGGGSIAATEGNYANDGHDPPPDLYNSPF